MYNRLIPFLTKHNDLYKYQSGFITNYSTALTLTEVVDNIYAKLDNQEYVIGIYLDLQKAFDTVYHEILHYKLFNCGIRGVVHEWFKSYLSDIQQSTVVASTHSRLAKITCGVLQGSVLGPLLFLLYVNDIAYLFISHLILCIFYIILYVVLLCTIP
jgi:Reverse transcriptase (RNA-dependent DNA polymerase)